MTVYLLPGTEMRTNQHCTIDSSTIRLNPVPTSVPSLMISTPQADFLCLSIPDSPLKQEYSAVIVFLVVLERLVTNGHFSVASIFQLVLSILTTIPSLVSMCFSLDLQQIRTLDGQDRFGPSVACRLFGEYPILGIRVIFYFSVLFQVPVLEVL